MNVFIIENETIAVEQLERMLVKLIPNINIVNTSGSVRECIDLFSNPQNSADLVFMDVELSDGNCFDILDEVDINVPIIITTVYDTYAIKAFEVNSVDYILKPIKEENLKIAISKSLKNYRGTDIGNIINALAQGYFGNDNISRKRFLVRINSQIFPVLHSDISYVFSMNKSNVIVTKDGRHLVIEKSINEMESVLDKHDFFRISRSCIIARSCISDWFKVHGLKYRINMVPEPDFLIEVSMTRSEKFLKWIQS